MAPRKRQSDLPGDSSRKKTAPNPPRAAAITSGNLEQYTDTDGCVNPALLIKAPPKNVPPPFNQQQIPETSPERPLSPVLHDSPQPESTSVANRDLLFPHTKDRSSHTMAILPDAASVPAPSESAVRATVATAPEVEEATFNDPSANGQIVKRCGCLIDNSTFIVTFDVNQLPTELAVRFMRRSNLGKPHRYAKPTHFDVSVLNGLANQLSHYWPPGADTWERISGPFSVFFEDRIDTSVRNSECAHCIWLRVQGCKPSPCSWQDWDQKTYIEACQRCIADGKFCMVPDYGRSTNADTKSDLPMILPMPVEWYAGEQVFRVPRQLEFWVNKAKHQKDLGNEDGAESKVVAKRSRSGNKDEAKSKIVE